MQDICNVFTDKCLKCFRTVREGDPQALIAVGKVVGGDALSRGYTRLGIPTQTWEVLHLSTMEMTFHTTCWSCPHNVTIWDQCVIISKVPSSVSGCCKRARAPRSPLPTWSSTLATTEIELKLSHLEHLDHEAPVEIELHVQVQTQENQVPASDRKLCRECLTTSPLAP